MNIRESFADFISGGALRKQAAETQAMGAVARNLYEAYIEGPYSLPPEMLLKQLKEYDAALLYDLEQQMQYDMMGGYTGISLEEDWSEWSRAVMEARRLWRYDVVTQWVIWTWTNFGFGENVHITPADENAMEVWDEFWTADRNCRVLAAHEIHHLSERACYDGNIFLLYYISTTDGKATIRVLDDPTQVKEIISNPEDKSDKGFYKREYVDAKHSSKTYYYSDYHLWLEGEDLLSNESLAAKYALPSGSEIATQDGTIAIVQHIAHNRKTSEFGWPLMAAAAPWIRTHKRFREDRASVAAANAMFLYKLTGKNAGSRAIDAVMTKWRSSLAGGATSETNPPPAAGSAFITNEALDMTKLPMSSGASDAKTDGEALMLMAALGGGLFPHWMGEGDAYRLATATAMELPLLKEFSRYQLFWSSQFRTMVKIVLTASERYGSAKYETMDADVSTDQVVATDLESISKSMASLYRDALVPVANEIPEVTRKAIYAATWRTALKALGVDDADSFTSDTVFGIEYDNDGNPIPTTTEAPDQGEEPPEPEGGEEPPEGNEEPESNEEQPLGLEMAEGDPIKPKGEPLAPVFADVEVTAADVEKAIADFNSKVPDKYKGLLNAKPSEPPKEK